MHPRTAASWNDKWENTFPETLTKDMSVQKGTGDFDVTINVGYWLCDGVLVQESTALTDEVTLDSPSASDRIDVIYGTFAYEADTEPTPASYGIKKGTPSSSPNEPSLGAHEVKVASIYVPSTATTLSDCYIKDSRTMLAVLANLLERDLEASVWAQAVGDPFLTSGNPGEDLVYETGIKDGDLWVDLGGLDLYIYDADLNQWVTSDVSAHHTTHHCGGADPLDIKDLCDVTGYRHLGTATAHDALGLSHDSLVDVSKNDHHTEDHNTRHACGQGDPLDVKDLCDIEEWLHSHAQALATDPHGNEQHDPNFAEEDHTHVFGDMTGVVEKGAIMAAAGAPTVAVPSGELWWGIFPNIAITDSVVRIIRLEVSVKTAPTQNITFTFKRNGSSIGTVTVNASANYGYNDLGSPVTVTPASDNISIEGPADPHSAEGHTATFIWDRYVEEPGE